MSDLKSVSHVVKFDGTNYQYWKFEITLALELHDLLEVVLGKEKKPEKDDPNLADWSHKDLRAKNFILACTEINAKRWLTNCKTSAEMWSDLAAQFSKSSPAFLQHLQHQYYDYRFKVGVLPHT